MYGCIMGNLGNEPKEQNAALELRRRKIRFAWDHNGHVD